MNARSLARLGGWSLFALSLLLFLAALVLNLGRPQYTALAFTRGELVTGAALVAFGWFGALIVARRPSHPVGWILCAFGTTGALEAFGSEYAIYGLVRHPGAVPGAAGVSWFTLSAYTVVLGLLAALLCLFPTGRPPSPRWRWVLWLAGIANGGLAVTELAWWPLRGVTLLQAYSDEPVGVDSTLYTLLFITSLAAVLMAVASLVVRFRRATIAERAQIKWLILAVATILVGVPIASLLLVMLDGSELVADAVLGGFITFIPASVGAAILRYHLYDIDRLIKRTLVYGLVTTVLVVAYTITVLVAGQLLGGSSAEAPSWTVAGATLAVAAVFRPVKRGIQHAMDRRFYRRSYNAAKTIGAYSARLRDEFDPTTVTADLMAVVAETMQPTVASLWLQADRAADSRLSEPDGHHPGPRRPHI